MTPPKFETTGSLRRIPKQGRGQRRVEHILKSAEELFAEVGFDNATTNAVAAKAGVSIGSLYQFFESKDSILEAIAGRYLDQTRAYLEKSMANVGNSVNIEAFIGGLLESMIKLQEQRPYYLQCLAWSRPSPVLNRQVDELYGSIAKYVENVLVRVSTETDPKTLKLQAEMCVGSFGALLPLALYAHGKDRARSMREIQNLLVRYLAPTLKRQESVK